MGIQQLRQGGRGRTLLGFALLLLGAIGVIGPATPVEARLDPFYIVHGAGYGAVTPRILFVLDSSSSMAADETYDPNAPSPDTKCEWDHCEDSQAAQLQSRIHAAREVIAELAVANAGAAEFGLMSFGAAAPPQPGSVPAPEPCVARSTVGPVQIGERYRFTWVTQVNQGHADQWQPAHNVFGGQGVWVLCGDNRPFPYLRHDDLGGFTLPDDSTAPLLDQPLYPIASDAQAYASHANRERKVQWFPRFLGRRFNLDCSDSYEHDLVNASVGDYGDTNAFKQSQICGRDFYYWPYVDGQPGYSRNDGLSEDDMNHQECDDDGICAGHSDPLHRLGVTRRDQAVGATLYAPFYSKAVTDNPNVANTEQGPRSQADAELLFHGIVDHSFAGGADVSGYAPMAAAVGVPADTIITDGNGHILGPDGSLTQSNRPFSHATISSYLAFMRLAETEQLCRPMSMIIVADGQPDPWTVQGGTELYERLRSVRRLLGVKSYVVAYTPGAYAEPTDATRTHDMACAAAGANSTATPCLGGNDLSNWDTCADPDDPAEGCAWLAADRHELATTLDTIVSRALAMDVPSGAPTTANDFQRTDPDDPQSPIAAAQTTLAAWTQAPAWTGHLTREGCTDKDPDNPGQLADYCKNVNALPLASEELESFGPCPRGRVWDAGECLALTNWADRRIYTHDLNNEVIRVADQAGAPTPAFIDLVEALDGLGRLDPPLSNDPDQRSAERVAMAQWLLGRELPDNWKLAGTPNSAPILIRRVPRSDPNFMPSVGIRDPHCAGRRGAEGDAVPDSLEQFAADAWQLSAGGGFADHYDYAEAVLIGDDFGMLHGFHYDSGNELFGFVPAALLNNSRRLSINGPARFGQAAHAAAHVYGIASTVNAGWAYDEGAGVWRHLAVFGLGPGGSEIMTLDVSHMGRLQDDDPIEVMWTSSTAANAADYAATLGQTWSRPALTYATPNYEMSLEPAAYLVFGSGYRDGVGESERGRTIWVVDAMTGETVTQRAYVTPISGTFDDSDDVTQVSDIAVGSHCLSRYWGEMQEAYWADSGGRLFRWDLAAAASDVTSFPHVADSGGPWPENPDGFAIANEAVRFTACTGEADFSCSIAGDNEGEVFSFSPAVVANHRIDDINNPGTLLPLGARDQFLIALASGNPNDAAIDGGEVQSSFHSSIYLLADDHRGEPSGGLDIPSGAGTTAPGAHPHFMRLPLSSIERTRRIYFPDGTTTKQVRNFSKAARPLRAPMIRVTGLADGEQQLDAEVYYVTYTIYEPGDPVCDGRWYDQQAGQWVADPGATYELRFRLVLSGDAPFDFLNGYTLPGDFGDGFGTGGGLSGPIVAQQDCGAENCGARLRAPKTSPCDPNQDVPPFAGAISVPLGYAELPGFSPLELEL